VAVAAEHPIALHAAKNQSSAGSIHSGMQTGFSKEADLATQEKKGMDPGLFVIHPLNGKKLPGGWPITY